MRQILKSSFSSTVILSLSVLLIPAVISCERDEGPGGLSSISGTIITRDFNMDGSLLLNEYPAMDENVYILYGDRSNIGDETETSHTGYYKFEYLTPGKYTVYFYSADSLQPSSEENEVFQLDVDLENKQDANLGKLYTYRYLDFNDGHASISGKVFMINYLNSATTPLDDDDIKDIVPAEDYEVYLKYGGNEGYDERIRTDYEGKFVFKNLIKGDYRIYVYSEDVIGGRYEGVTDNIIYYPQSNGSYDLALYRDIAINEEYQIASVDTFYSEKY